MGCMGARSVYTRVYRIGTPINVVLCTNIPSLAGFLLWRTCAYKRQTPQLTATYPSRVRRRQWKLLVVGYTITTLCRPSPQKLLKCREAVIWFHLLERSVGLAIYCGGRMCFCWHYLPCQPWRRKVRWLVKMAIYQTAVGGTIWPLSWTVHH
jgi:hypothetical protein